MPVLGDAAYIPSGSLAQFKAAALAAASTRRDIVLHADSLGIGETQTGGTAAYWSWFSNTLRARFAAAGITDGGRGLSGRTPGQDYASNSGDSLASVQTRSGWAATMSDSLIMGFTATSTTVGDTIRFQGYGTKLRLIWRAAQYAAYGKFSYAVDGGSATTVTPSTSAGYQYVVIDLGADALHYVDLVNVGGATALGDGRHEYVSVTPDWFRATGLVWNNHSVSGQSAAAYIAGNNKLLPVSFGLAPAGATNDWEAAVDASADARKLALGMFSLGTNDSDDAQIATAISKYARTCRQANGDALVLIPALEDKSASARAARQSATKAQCVASGVPYIDLGSAGALGPTSKWLADYGVGSLPNPHLTTSAYTKQGNFVADILLTYIAA